MSTTGYKSILLDSHGRAVIDGTGIKVRELVLDHLAYGWSPQELRWQHPVLSLSQVHAALAYYYENSQQMDEDIRADLAWVEAEREKSQASPLHLKLSGRVA